MEDYPSPANLKAEVADHDVTLTWDTPDTPVTPINPGGTKSAIIEDFESYPNWVIHPKGKYEWSYIDGDGGKPYRNDYADMPFPTDGTPVLPRLLLPMNLARLNMRPIPLIVASVSCFSRATSLMPTVTARLLSPTIG